MTIVSPCRQLADIGPMLADLVAQICPIVTYLYVWELRGVVPAEGIHALDTWALSQYKDRLS